MNRFKLTLPKSTHLNHEERYASLKTLVPPTVLRIGVFFDGTGNKPQVNWQNASNIYRLYEIYPVTLGTDTHLEEPSCKIYARGVGTSKWTILEMTENATGLNGELRSRGCMYEIIQCIKKFKNKYRCLPKTIKLDVFGFSRGAAIARHFVNVIVQGFIDKDSYKKNLATIDFSFEFLGLFDTVASIGLAGNAFNPGYALHVPIDKIKKVVHLVAEDELRSGFDLISVVSDPKYHKSQNEINGKVEEILCPGVHADIGGGYLGSSEEHGLNNSKLSVYYFNLMIDKAIENDVPFKEGSKARVDREMKSALEGLLRMYREADNPEFRFLCRIYRHIDITLKSLARKYEDFESPKKTLNRDLGDFLTVVVEGETLDVDVELLKETHLKMGNYLNRKTSYYMVPALNVFYSKYVHDSLMSENIGMWPQYQKLPITIEKKHFKTSMFIRKVFTENEIDMSNEEYEWKWWHGLRTQIKEWYDLDRVLPEKQDCVIVGKIERDCLQEYDTNTLKTEIRGMIKQYRQVVEESTAVRQQHNSKDHLKK